MIRVTTSAAVLAAAFLVSACSNDDPVRAGRAQPATSAATQAAPAKIPDACTLFQPIVKEKKLTHINNHPLGTTVSGCDAQNEEADFGVEVRSQGLDQFRSASLAGKNVDSTIAGHKAVVNDAGRLCSYGIEVTPTSRVDFTYSGSTEKGGCAKSKSLAEQIAQQLPPGQ